MALQLPYVVGSPSDPVQGNFDTIATNWPNLTPEVTSLPTVPADGMTVDLLVDSAGAYGGPFLWRCKYRAATVGSKWHVLSGGPPLISKNATSDAFTNTTYALPANPVSIVAPVTGVYLTEHSAQLYANTANNFAYSDLHIAGVAQGGQQIVRMTPSVAWFSALGEFRSAKWPFNITAGQTVDQRVAVTAGGATVAVKLLSLTPLRIG